MAQQTSLFEAMPLELHFKVLSHLSSPEDVLSTIRASPAALKAIATGRERVYASVLQAALAPEVFRELLAIVNAPDHNKCPPVPPPSQETNDASIEEWRAWERGVRSFLKRHARGAVYPTPDPHVDIINFKIQIGFMVQLYFCLSKFVNYYQIFVQSIAGRTWPAVRPNRRIEQVQQDHDWPRLTATELLRLQRGLLRHEICCRLIGLPSQDLRSNEDFSAHLANELVKPQHPGHDQLWWLHPFDDLLPIDELEEISCASVYLMGLFQTYLKDNREELRNHLLVLAQGCGNQALGKDIIDEKMETVGDLLLQAQDQHPMLHFDLFKYDPARNWAQRMSQLGLVFLDQRSSSLEDEFYKKPGPYCSPMTKNFILNGITIDDIHPDKTDCLRALGWVFFDDVSKLRYLGLQPDVNASTMLTWLDEARCHRDFWPSLRLELPASLRSKCISKDDWHEKVITKYSGKVGWDEYKAMTRFVAGIRAVVDFNSTQLPTFE
ncbi:hypothetical protein N8I77_007089 [Diaporthe amygdali]|uniref:F-box domain-containing protein n=1 Tax=Phomopsis amygdali TaxID=1214568 RepID=A0AAD9W1I8_PHOAM|nr:hypothetical protein N8I77_007089 [Diaporthe amygdali]